ncbi:uncharacterized protein BDZ83DRAFT_577028 [Colletotrichum acutatum]|uniref:Uncharacterized protein n=1 Tax=Glomerella acutata TaxID=27357 RepID=A0AAD8UPW8_GLOAC|nr:uncharacterized protein BDZ83DRAFT_577028 [Colletotrichum acutatum]KAK1725216.1 hypothetical protein BDZ83DRAFT_577028 [Colletotrichum acutatum]
MCHTIAFKLPCEHIQTQIEYCSKASASSKKDSSKRKTCRDVTQQNIPYPPPPGYDQRALPKCPLANCPYESRNRCWNCCWCGKGWNDGGRCSCIMIIDGNEYRCEHICCLTCTAAMDG